MKTNSLVAILLLLTVNLTAQAAGTCDQLVQGALQWANLKRVTITDRKKELIYFSPVDPDAPLGMYNIRTNSAAFAAGRIFQHFLDLNPPPIVRSILLRLLMDTNLKSSTISVYAANNMGRDVVQISLDPPIQGKPVIRVPDTQSKWQLAPIHRYEITFRNNAISIFATRASFAVKDSNYIAGNSASHGLHLLVREASAAREKVLVESMAGLTTHYFGPDIEPSAQTLLFVATSIIAGAYPLAPLELKVRDGVFGAEAPEYRWRPKYDPEGR